jgi:AcrR family transcriptional regulator
MPSEALTNEAPIGRDIPDTPKSRRTRGRILDAAMRLFAERGYDASGLPQIAEAADLTRGAMLYHFPDRESLVDAVVPHIQQARQHLLQAAVNAMPHGADRADYAIDSYWRLLHEAPFVAFAELERAARTDPLVGKRLAPAQDAFDRAEIGENLFDLVQGGHTPRLQAGRDLARFMLEGLSRARLAYDGEQRTERLLQVVKRAARMLNRKGSVQDLWPES